MGDADQVPTQDGRGDERLRAYSQMLFSHPPTDMSSNPQLRFARRYLPDDRRSDILDAGCGNGAYAMALSREGYTSIIGVDLFPSVDTQGLFTYRQASIDATSLADESVDFVLCFSVIYHLVDPSSGLAEFRRVMRPGARLVFTAHTRYSLFTLDRLVRRRLGGVAHLRGVRFRSAREYAALLGGLGFEAVEVDGYRLNYFDGGRAKSALRRVLHVRRRSPRPNPASAPDAALGAGDPRWMRRLRSEFGYHLLIAARKPHVAECE